MNNIIIGRSCGCQETVMDLTPANTKALRAKQRTACPDCAKPTEYRPVGIECWDHCSQCHRSQNRFWVISAEEFEKARKKVPHCMFCGGPLETFHFRNRAFEVHVCPEGFP